MSDFFHACRRQSVQSRLHVTVLNGSMYGQCGWFFKREINNSEGSAENVTRASFRTLQRHVNEKKPREHILTSTIKNIVHILSGLPICRTAARVVFAHSSRLQTCFRYARGCRNYNKHTYVTLYMLDTYVTTARRAAYAMSYFISLQRKKNAFHSYVISIFLAFPSSMEIMSCTNAFD